MTVLPDRQGFYDYPLTPVITGNTSYFSAYPIVWHGTDLVGLPTKITIVGGIVDTGALISIRIQDITNSLTIAEQTSLSVTYPSFIDMGTLSNLSTGRAIWEVQLLSVNQPGPDGDVAVGSLFMEHN